MGQQRIKQKGNKEKVQKKWTQDCLAKTGLETLAREYY